MMTNFFSKKLLVYFILIIFSTSLYSAPPKRQNIDLKPFEIILNKYFDICEKAQAKRYDGKFDQNSINEMRKLLTPEQSERGAMSELGQCSGAMAISDGDRRSFTKDELTKDFKVRSAYYHSNKQAYVVTYYYFKYEHKLKTGTTIYFRPIKDKDGNIVWKII